MRLGCARPISGSRELWKRVRLETREVLPPVRIRLGLVHVLKVADENGIRRSIVHLLSPVQLFDEVVHQTNRVPIVRRVVRREDEVASVAAMFLDDSKAGQELTVQHGLVAVVSEVRLQAMMTPPLKGDIVDDLARPRLLGVHDGRFEEWPCCGPE